MIIVLKPRAKESEVKAVAEKIKKMGLKPHVSMGVERTIIGAIGDESLLKEDQLKAMAVVEKVLPIMKPYKLVSREFQKENTIIKVGDVKIGTNDIIVMAGPCAVESEKQVIETAKAVKKAGGHIFRGGAFKPRTSPYSFQGMGEEGLKLLAKARNVTGMPIVTEVMDTADVPLVADYADILQVGTRNMQNFNLLKAVGKVNKPVMLKRGLAATLNEFLMAAEYIMAEGNHNVILCERGIRTFCTHTRNTLDLNIIPIIKKESHLPIIVDPSHGTGNYSLVSPMSKAAIACGADGLMIEVHSNPEEATSDGDQSLTPKSFAKLMEELRSVAKAVGRRL
ncbi:MAG: 3-deoxy-7-phosphoheptulonate synthase [Nanoarchaeota archaeon]|nr:3-deoxy-7-phosphoheptulonate synthase [Nanoarchaeota archaeon]MBU1004353.1 3-deoxy-7-phosphoheptulonate synthase [Nanoarchaeota archaeon]MBU1946296.1 3-deoxy-7-phosphoheptulonate synthase [Nanoarchaeota archaeon]